MKCSSCSADVPAGARFCPACASPVFELGADADGASEVATALARKDAGRPPSSTSQLSSAPAIDGSRFLPGTLLAERYRIVGVLGRGGMGELYRADDLKLGQPVALKFLPSSVEQDEEWLDRFLNEVQIARQLCAGLAAAHDQGVLHRDLKPANVMIDGRGNARLTDFGLAGLVKNLSPEDVRSGTPAYMAPEQLGGREVTVRSDLYALGLVLYQLFTGEKAFKADSLAELSRLHQESAPTSPSSLVDSLDAAVERVILRCLDKEPARRPKTALEVSAALPGGDPLAAALAAGETPSPEMVAAAGEEGSLAPKTALALLLGFLLPTVAFIGLAGRYQVTADLPLELASDVLLHKSGELLDRLGVDREEAGDSAWGLSYDQDLQRLLQTEWAGEKEPWVAVREGRPALLRFWYRQSPKNLVVLRNFPSAVSWGEPPYESSGMASIRLDTKGRLLDFIRVPPQLEDSPATPASDTAPAESDWPPEPNWKTLFEAAQLDMRQFTATSPTWVPPVYADRRAAWTGPLESLEGVELRIEAAA
ncbi:MAG: protein kinase [Thermoanaerobaculia bacterium]